MLKFVYLLLLGIHSTGAVTHSLKYFYTASSGLPNFPSYVSVGLVDDVQISYCDSIINKNVPKQEWMNKVSSEHPGYWEEETVTCLDKQQTFKYNLEIAKQRFNQTEGVHVFQQMYGCEWDDETGQIYGYDQFGYDGEDLIVLDLMTQSWISLTPQGVVTIHKWDDDRAALQHERFYLTQACVAWLMKYVSYGRSSMIRTDLPSVSFLQRNSSSPISCHATGFYPNRAEMFWRKDGEEIHDGVVKGEIFPNNDGTFQMTVDIDLSSVSSEDWMKYECVFQLSGVNEDITERLEKTRILTNESNTIFLIIAVVFAVLVPCLISVIGLIIYKMKNVKGLKTSVIQRGNEQRPDHEEKVQGQEEPDTKTSTACPETSSLTSDHSDSSSASDNSGGSQDSVSSETQLIKR